MEKEKSCFLISPIGEPGSDIRELADKVRLFLKREVLSELKYTCTRADDITAMGMITNDVIGLIFDSDLAIALLDYDNVNVYYELALRHVTSKACISIVSREHRQKHHLPFDVRQERSFDFPLAEMKEYRPGGSLTSELGQFRNNLIEVIEGYENQRYAITNPVTVASHQITIPPRMNMEDVMRHIDGKLGSLNSEFDGKVATMHKDMLERFQSMGAIMQNWMPEDLKSAVQDMYQNGSAIYISGEKEAFAKLTDMTKTAQRSLRTSRYAPQAISSSHSDFFHAVCEFGKKKDVVCKRIMCVNESEKEVDILKIVLDTYGGSMELYLTDRDNNFELVVIDDTCAFLHFYDDDRHIKSTLFIRGQRVVKEFEKIYDRFLEPSNDDHKLVLIRSSDFTSPEQIFTDVPKIIAQFKKSEYHKS